MHLPCGLVCKSKPRWKMQAMFQFPMWQNKGYAVAFRWTREIEFYQHVLFYHRTFTSKAYVGPWFEIRAYWGAPFGIATQTDVQAFLITNFPDYTGAFFNYGTMPFLSAICIISRILSAIPSQPDSAPLGKTAPSDFLLPGSADQIALLLRTNW